MSKRKWNKQLRKAVQNQDLAKVQEALDNGADPDTRSFWENPPLFKACEYEDTAILEALIHANANLDATKLHNWTAVYICASQNKIKALTILLKAGADPNIQTHDWQETALYIAIDNAHKEVAAILVQFGANPYIANHKNINPRDLAYQKGLHDLAETLGKKWHEYCADNGQEEQHSEEQQGQEQPAPATQDTPPDTPYTVTSPYIATKFEGVIEGLGALRSLFNFQSRTFTQLVDKSSGPPIPFYKLTAEQEDEVNKAREWMQSQGHNVPDPIKVAQPVTIKNSATLKSSH